MPEYASHWELVETFGTLIYLNHVWLHFTFEVNWNLIMLTYGASVTITLKQVKLKYSLFVTDEALNLLDRPSHLIQSAYLPSLLNLFLTPSLTK
jgi:hypothetical protein